MAAAAITAAQHHAATAVKQDTTNTNVQRSFKTTSFSKTIEYLPIKTATFHVLDGTEPTPIHGASGMSIASKPTPPNKNARRKLLPPPVSPPLVSVASVEAPSILVGTAQLWTPSLKTAIGPILSGEQPHTKSLYSSMASP